MRLSSPFDRTHWPPAEENSVAKFGLGGEREIPLCREISSYGTVTLL